MQAVGAYLRRLGEGLWSAIGWLLVAIVRTLGQILGWIAIPFVLLWRLFWRLGRVPKIVIAVLLVPLAIGYLHFFWHAAWIRGYDVAYAQTLGIDQHVVAPGRNLPDNPAACGPSYIAEATIRLIEFNVDTNLWMSSNPFYKAGFFFLIPWDQTKLFDNKASLQRGVHQGVQRTLTEMSDRLGRVRGTSEIDPDLSAARGNIQFDPYTWAINPFSTRPLGPTTRSATYYRNAADSIRSYQTRLTGCEASFDDRADNLLQFIDSIASDLGSTSALLMERADETDSGWFDTRADDYFMEAKGKMYAYAGILAGARADFDAIIDSREIELIWDNLTLNMAAALELDPMIISNGAEDGWVMPSHLTTLGFYILRARSNLVEIRSVLDR